MRLRVENLSLVGTARDVAFQPGLNVIVGPITTGKSTLINLLRVLLGSSIPPLPPEARQHVSAVAGQLLLGDERASVVRTLVGTPTAPVDVATGSGLALRLPALQMSSGATTTYGRWLLGSLGLPDLNVAAAPTRPAESATTAVSINDYLGYCRLSQEEIDTSVFGSGHPSRNIKRQYVFRILYGLFDARHANLQEDLRRVESELRLVRAGAESFMRFLQDTAWENRAVLEQQRDDALNRRRELDEQEQVTAIRARHVPRAQELRIRLQQLDATLAEARAQHENERRSVMQLEELAAQLETQLNRLTKSIVAGSRLYDIDFRVCPRCASPVQTGREDAGHCYLCLQVPQASLSREDLVQEQDRIAAQIEETTGLVATRQVAVARLERRLTELEAERSRTGRDLDEQTQVFVSDVAEEIARRAAERADIDAAARRAEDYLELYERLDAAYLQETELQQRREQIEAEIAQAELVETGSAARIDRLEERFAELVDAFGTPRFEGEPRAAIDRRTFLPILNGRAFEQLSSGGLKVLANLAYALAHHLTALDLNLSLPGLLMIDGITKNVGRDEYDRARVDAVFDTLRQVGAEHGDQLQLIVATNDVPEAVADRVVLRLAEDDRLIPMAQTGDLE